jgi:hypothetical protein
VSTAEIIPLVPRVIAEQIRWIEQIQDEQRARLLAEVVATGLTRLLRAGAINEDAALVSMLAVTLRFPEEPWAVEVFNRMQEVNSPALRREARRRLEENPTGARAQLLQLLAGHR